MKKLFTFFTFSILTFCIAAQTEKGTFYMALGNGYSPIAVNGVVSSIFSNSSAMSLGNEWITGITIDGDDDDDQGNDYWDDQKQVASNFNISTQTGFFLADGFLTGLGVEYATVKFSEEEEDDFDGDGANDDYTAEEKYSSLAFSPFIKYYIPINNNALFLSSSYTFGTVKNNFESEYDYNSGPSDEFESENEPYKTSRLQFGAGLALFLTKSIALEPSINYALNKYTQEREYYVTTDSFGSGFWDDQDHVTTSNAFYVKVAASMFF